jgi:hypothetical protein
MDGEDALVQACYIQEVRNVPFKQVESVDGSSSIMHILLSPCATCPPLHLFETTLEGSGVVAQVVCHDREQLPFGLATIKSSRIHRTQYMPHVWSPSSIYIISSTISIEQKIFLDRKVLCGHFKSRSQEVS